MYGPARRHRTRSTIGEYPRPKASSMSEIGKSCNCKGDDCQDHVSVTVTMVGVALGGPDTSSHAAVPGRIGQLTSQGRLADAKP